MQTAKVLIVEDSASLALGYAAQLEDAGHEVSLSETLADARRALSEASFDVVLLDLQLPDGDGLTIFDAWTGKADAPNVIVVTADGSLNRAVAAMRPSSLAMLSKVEGVGEKKLERYGTSLLKAVEDINDRQDA